MACTHLCIFSAVLKAIAGLSPFEARFGAELNEPCSNLAEIGPNLAMASRSELFVFAIFVAFRHLDILQYLDQI